jgi:hypothetical protein
MTSKITEIFAKFWLKKYFIANILLVQAKMMQVKMTCRIAFKYFKISSSKRTLGTSSASKASLTIASNYQITLKT